MRYLLVAVLIVLLPLRSWAAHTMGTEMAAQQAQGGWAAAVEAVHTTQASMPADCPMHAGTPVQAAEGAANGELSDSLCKGCANCQLCMALAHVSWSPWDLVSISPESLARHHGTRFSSADLRFSLKPPIL